MGLIKSLTYHCNNCDNNQYCLMFPSTRKKRAVEVQTISSKINLFLQHCPI